MPQVKILEIDCYEVRGELVNYMEEEIEPELRGQIEAHLRNCHHCTAVYDGVRNVVHLLGSKQSIELPAGFSQRLYKRLLSTLRRQSLMPSFDADDDLLARWYLGTMVP